MRAKCSIAVIASCAALLTCAKTYAATTCAEEQSSPQLPADPALCEALLPIVRKPSALPLNEYQGKLADYLRNFCHRDEKAGWKVDKHVRDTGPWIGTYANGHWTGIYYGTHAPALIWYSPDMYAWLKLNRPSEGTHPPGEAQPVPDGAIIVKEMYQAPAAGCARVDPIYLRPGKEGAAIMVRDSGGSHDGWFWGWFGWRIGSRSSRRKHEYPFIGFSHCTIATPRRRTTRPFRSKNIKGEWGSRSFSQPEHFPDPSWQSLQSRIAQAEARRHDPSRSLQPGLQQNVLLVGGAGSRVDVRCRRCPMTVLGEGRRADRGRQFITSDQCLAASAGGTGLQYA